MSNTIYMALFRDAVKAILDANYVEGNSFFTVTRDPNNELQFFVSDGEAIDFGSILYHEGRDVYEVTMFLPSNPLSMDLNENFNVNFYDGSDGVEIYDDFYMLHTSVDMPSAVAWVEEHADDLMDWYNTPADGPDFSEYLASVGRA